MFFEIILGSISAIAGVTTLLEMQSSRELAKEISSSLYEIKSLLTVLQNEISERPYPWSEADETVIRSRYDPLIEVLRANRHYSSHLAIQPTEYGTWKVVRVPKHEKKPTILRDPGGEYKDTFEEAAEIDDKSISG